MKKVLFVIALLLVACNSSPTPTSYPVPVEEPMVLDTEGYVQAWFVGDPGAQLEVVPKVVLYRSPPSSNAQRSNTPFENIDGLNIELKPGYSVDAQGELLQFIIRQAGTEYVAPVLFKAEGDVIKIWSSYRPVCREDGDCVDELVFPASEDVYIRTIPEEYSEGGEDDIRIFVHYDGAAWYLSLWGDLQ